MEKSILDVIWYFRQFEYPPSSDDIRIYYPGKISTATLKRAIDRLKKKRKIIEKGGKYTIPPYSTCFSKYTVRTRYSRFKIHDSGFYIWLLSLLPQIQLIGYSGSLSMMNAKKNDDVDLFIICERNRLWTGRLLALVIAQLLGKRRKRGEKHTQNKICLNLFFEKTDMTIPKEKKV